MIKIKLLNRIHVEFMQLAVLAVFICLSFYLYSQSIKSQNNTLFSYAEYPADFSNDKILIGASHNIFVGKVIKKISTKDLGLGPETQFEVRIIENIKGNVKDIAKVDQFGGYLDGKLYVMTDDSSKSKDPNEYLLQPGFTYLFMTRYNKEQDRYTLNSYSTALKLLNTRNDLPDIRLKELVDLDDRVEKIKNNYPKEVLLEADVKNKNTLNSYKSLKEK